MTSRKSFFNSHTMIHTLTQTRYIMILHFIVLFLTTTVPAYARLERMIKWADLSIGSKEYVGRLLSGTQEASLAVVPIVGVMTIFVVFYYLFKANSVQFYSSIPQSRECVFISKFVGCLVSVAIPTAASLLINSIFYAALHMNQYFAYSTVLIGFGSVMLVYFSVMAFAAFAVTLSGNAFAAIVVMGFCWLWYPVTTLGITESFVQCFDHTTISFKNIVEMFYTPAMLLDVTSFKVIYTLIYGVVLLAAGILLCKYRRNENTEKFFVYRAPAVIIKYYTSMAGSLLLGVAFLSLSDNNIAIGFIGYIVMMFVIFVLLQAIFEKNMRNMFSNMKNFAIAVVIWCIAMGVCMSGILERDTIDASKHRNFNLAVGDMTQKIEDSDNMSAAAELLNKTLPTYDSDEEEYDPLTQSMYAHIELNPDNRFFVISEETKISDSDFMTLRKIVMSSEEYRNYAKSALNAAESVYVSRGNGGFFIDYNDDLNSDTYEYGRRIKMCDKDKVKELLAIVASDVDKYDYDACVESGVYATMSVNTESENVQISIYGCYDESVAFLEANDFDSVLWSDYDTAPVKVQVGVYNDVSIGDYKETELTNLYETSDALVMNEIFNGVGGSSYYLNTVVVTVTDENGDSSSCEYSYNSLSKYTQNIINPQNLSFGEWAK